MTGLYALITIIAIASDGSQAGGTGIDHEITRNLKYEECLLLKDEFLNSNELKLTTDELKPLKDYYFKVTRKAKCIKTSGD